MFDCTGCLVQATAGRDKGEIFFVVGVDEKQGFLLLADGKRRKLSNPKRKNPAHAVPVDQAEFDHPAIQKLRQGSQLSDRELRRALAAFKGGNHAWQKTI